MYVITIQTVKQNIECSLSTRPHTNRKVVKQHSITGGKKHHKGGKHHTGRKTAAAHLYDVTLGITLVNAVDLLTFYSLPIGIPC